VLHADARGILALIAVAMCWALAVVLYRVGTLFAVPLIAYGILRTHLFDVGLRFRWTIKQSTLARALVVYFLAPLQRFAERVASGA
jgi:hypothetical protein